MVAVVSDQGASTTGFGNYVVLRHDFSEPTLINGQWVTLVHSLGAHLDPVGALSVGPKIGIGQQIGMHRRNAAAVRNSQVRRYPVNYSADNPSLNLNV